MQKFDHAMDKLARRSSHQQAVSEGSDLESIGAEVQDACEYLIIGAMPLRILGLILLFPVGIGFAFLLPKDENLLWTYCVQLLPVLIGVGLFFHYCTTIILHSSLGEVDAPSVFTGANSTIKGSLRSMFGAIGLMSLCMGPAVLAALVGQPQLLIVSLGAAGLFYLPMAFLALAINGSFESILPHVVLRGMRASGRNYIKLFLVFSMCLSLGILAALLLAHAPLYIQAAVVGPMLICPGIGFARLLGRFYYAHRLSLKPAIFLRNRVPAGSMSMRIEAREGKLRLSPRRKGLKAYDKRTGNMQGEKGKPRVIVGGRQGAGHRDASCQGKARPLPQQEPRPHAHTPLRPRR